MEPWELHPALVHSPIAFFVGAVVLDLYTWYRGEPGHARVVTGLLWAGVATAALAALAGVLAMFTGPASHTDESGKLFWWHVGTAVAQFVLFTLVALVRWRTQPAPAPSWTRVVGLVAVATLLVAGYLGGYIVYHGASGIEPSLLAPELRSKQQQKQGGGTESRSQAALGEQHRPGRQAADADSPVGIAPKLVSDDSRKAT